MIEPYEERNPFNVFWLTFVVRAASYAALACLVWEWFLTLKYEVSIWRKSKNVLYVKCLYSISRYLGIAAQIVNSVIVTYIHASRDLPRSFCQAWKGAQLAVGLCLILSLETILVTRLYALYNKSVRMSYLLVAVLFFEYIMVITCGIVTVRRVEFYDSCILSKIPLTVMLISSAKICTQCILWGLTLYKHITIRQGHGWQKVPLLSMVTRDGSWVSGVMILLLSLVVSDVTTKRPSLQIGRLCYIAFPSFIVMVSAANCRIIINMHEFPDDSDERRRHRNERELTGIELTSIFVSEPMSSNRVESVIVMESRC